MDQRRRARCAHAAARGSRDDVDGARQDLEARGQAPAALAVQLQGDRGGIERFGLQPFAAMHLHQRQRLVGALVEPQRVANPEAYARALQQEGTTPPAEGAEEGGVKFDPGPLLRGIFGQ